MDILKTLTLHVAIPHGLRKPVSCYLHKLIDVPTKHPDPPCRQNSALGTASVGPLSSPRALTKAWSQS